VLAGLGHWTVCGGYHEYCAVHLRCACHHVLDVIGVARAVNVGVVAFLALVLYVRGVDGDAAGFLLRGIVNFIEFLGTG